MAAQASPHSGVPAGSGDSGSAWRRGRGGGFEWVSPSPSPVVVAELERLFPDIVQVPVQHLEAEEVRWGSQSILARCLSRWIPPEIIIREFYRASLPGKIDALALANKHYIFHFTDVRAKALALGRPWVVFGQPIITAEWVPEFVPMDSSLHDALLWIRLPQLPIEFWNDEVLSSILAVAGEFLFSDDSTRERKRGSFARACVRVDLSRPLRPGARIRGSRAPFWQQFCYESLEGICADCGSVHLEGPCLAVPAPSSSSSGSGYGPWMAAIRRRRLHPTSISNGLSSASRPSPVVEEGWQVPKKVVRRQLSRGTAPPASGVVSLSPDLSNQGVQPVLNHPVLVAGEGSEAGSEVVNVPVGTVAMFQSAGSPEADIGHNSNPFACLGVESWTARPQSREGGTSGPLKRTRPADHNSQRVLSRTAKAKGKAPLGGRDGLQGSFSFQAAADSSRGSPDSSGPGKKRSRRKDGQGPRGASGPSLLAQPKESDHDTAVLLLKEAIFRGEEADTRDSPLLVGSRGHDPTVDSVPTGDPCVEVMVGDRVGVPPTIISE